MVWCAQKLFDKHKLNSKFTICFHTKNTYVWRNSKYYFEVFKFQIFRPNTKGQYNDNFYLSTICKDGSTSRLRKKRSNKHFVREMHSSFRWLICIKKCLLWWPLMPSSLSFDWRVHLGLIRIVYYSVWMGSDKVCQIHSSLFDASLWSANFHIVIIQCELRCNRNKQDNIRRINICLN